MHVLIDISKERFRWIKQRVEENKNEVRHLPYEYEMISKGTPFPKGNRDCKDAYTHLENLHSLYNTYNLTNTEKQSLDYAIGAINTLIDIGIIW